MAIGAPKNDGTGSDGGKARVYSYNGSSWTKLGQDIDGENAYDYFGSSVALNDDGDRLIVGATNNSANGPSSGHLRIFDWNTTSNTWVQAGDDLDGETAGDQSGYAIAINAFGNIIASGAPNNAGSGTGSGHVRIYQSNLCNIPLSVELLDNADASFDYTDSVYCSNASDPTPNITATNGGLFTS